MITAYIKKVVDKCNVEFNLFIYKDSTETSKESIVRWDDKLLQKCEFASYAFITINGATGLSSVLKAEKSDIT